MISLSHTVVVSTLLLFGLLEGPANELLDLPRMNSVGGNGRLLVSLQSESTVDVESKCESWKKSFINAKGTQLIICSLHNFL